MDPNFSDSTNSYLVVGAGVSGLYCAYKLLNKDANARVALMERLPKAGGRIETEHMNGFIAEYGPMRYERKLQLTFDKLLTDLNIGTVPSTAGVQGGGEDWPKYCLDPKKEWIKVEPKDPNDPEKKRPMTAEELLARGVALLTGWDEETPKTPEKWFEQNHEPKEEVKYDEWRENLAIEVAPGNVRKLKDIGFWNALSAPGILSHQAVLKIRDSGTFYHLLPDNVNAVEWAIWWARALTPKGREMVAIPAGSHEISKKLVAELEKVGRSRFRLYLQTEVRRLENAAFGNVVKVTFGATKHPGERKEGLFSHVFLALPKVGLVKLKNSLPKQITPYLDQAEAFSLLKVFWITSDPWWWDDERCKEDPENPGKDKCTPGAHTKSTLIPTREIHYQTNLATKHGMVLLYMDRPSTVFWEDFVKNKNNHEDPELNNNENLKKECARWLAEELNHACQENPDPKKSFQLKPQARAHFKGMDTLDIAKELEQKTVGYGIRDWALSSTGGAFHAWVAGADSLTVLKAFAGFSLVENPGIRDVKRVHICSEAYSNYQAFIEGGLRAVDDAIATLKSQAT